MVMLVGCGLISTSSKPELASPDNRCRKPEVSWQGVIPGQSTKSDVEKILGQPVEQGYSSVWERDFFLYPPTKSLIRNYGNTIVFRQDDVVDWVDVWVSNADGKFHTVAEFVDEYGATLDRVYVNGSFDMFGPDHVYVWSECGVALTAVPDTFIEKPIVLARSVEEGDYQLKLRYPVHPKDSIQPNLDVNHIVIRAFFFQPTNFISFQEVYANQIRHLYYDELFRLER